MDLRSYLDSPLESPECRIVSSAVLSGNGLSATQSGCVLTVSAGAEPSPTGRITVTVSDGPNRSATGAVSVTMLGRPGAPTAVAAQADRDAGGRARVSWSAPAYDGGAPIRSYTAKWTGGSSGSRECTASPCTIDGLVNGKDYFFTVTATNVVGESEPGGPSNAARPDTKPGPVSGVTMVSRGDGSLTIRWAAPENKGSPVSKYVLRLIPTNGGTPRTAEVSDPATTTTVAGLNNMSQYSVEAQAYNEAGPGPFGPATTMQSAGKPPAPAGFKVTADGPGATKDLAAITLTWNTTSPNGPPLKTYTVKRRVAGGAWSVLKTVAPSSTRTTDQVRYDGRKYDYVVTATNGADLESGNSSVQSFTSIGQPSTPSVTAKENGSDKRVKLTVRLGKPRASGFRSVTWRSSAGASGTYSCGSCPAEGTVTITTSALSTSKQTFTVTTNNGTRSSARSASSNQVQPYGPTPQPVANGGSTSGKTVTFKWTLPTNGRPITRVKVSGAKSYSGSPITSISVTAANYAQDVTIRVVAVSAAGDSTPLTMTRRTANPPDPVIYNIRNGPLIIDETGDGTGDCGIGGRGCPQVMFDIKDFPTGSGRWRVEESRGYHSTWRDITVHSATSYTPAYRPIFGKGVGQLRVVIDLDGKPTYYSSWVDWDAPY